MKKQNLNGYQKQKPTLGKMRTVNEQINMLPQIGSEVVIYENVLLPERKKRETGLSVQYMPSDSYLDAHYRPKTWTITGYTKGIEKPLDPQNRVELINNKTKSVTFETSIRTILIATGCMKLVPIQRKSNKNEKEVPIFED